MTDRQIVDLYWQRSERAIAETDTKYGRYCYAIAYNILANTQDSEECVNDTWMSAWNAMPSKRPDRLNPFLGRITRNGAISKALKQSTQKRGGGDMPLALDELDECIPSGYALETELEAKELAVAINDFVRAMKPEAQKAFMARYYFLATEKEIAERLGCSRTKVNALLKRSRNELRTYLIKEGLCEILND